MSFYLEKEKENLTYKSKYKIQRSAKKINHLNLLPVQTFYFIDALWDLKMIEE